MLDMPATATYSKRPRIDPANERPVADLFPNEPFERAVNRIIEEAVDTRAVIAEMILDLEGERPRLSSPDYAKWRERRNELALEMNAVNLLRVLKLRLRDRDVDL